MDKSGFDISLLECTGTYKASAWLDCEPVALRTNTAVDLVGYPGDYTLRYLAKVQRVDLSESEGNEVKLLFPPLELIVSHGYVLEEGDVVSYKLSSTGGMSGGPILLDGKVVGYHLVLITYFRYSYRRKYSDTQQVYLISRRNSWRISSCKFGSETRVCGAQNVECNDASIIERQKRAKVVYLFVEQK